MINKIEQGMFMGFNNILIWFCLSSREKTLRGDTGNMRRLFNGTYNYTKSWWP